MEWYNYMALFFSGMFLSNAIPHFIHGISGDKFPTPFAKPPGKGLSPARINVWWSAANVLVGIILFKAGRFQSGNYLSTGVFLVGFFLMALMLSGNFVKKDKE